MCRRTLLSLVRACVHTCILFFVCELVWVCIGGFVSWWTQTKINLHVDTCQRSLRSLSHEVLCSETVVHFLYKHSTVWRSAKAITYLFCCKICIEYGRFTTSNAKMLGCSQSKKIMGVNILCRFVATP